MVYELNQVSVSYAGRTALQDVSCTIQEGKWISVIGQTGAGKSTFAKILKGLIPDFNGEYLMDQQSIPRDSKGRVKVVPDVGFVFQYPEHQLFETTVYKELAFAPKMQGYSAQQIEQVIELILPQVGLSKEILPYAPFQLSGGQKRRIAIASVLLMNPRLLILDEPTAGLDPLSRADLLRMLKQWQQQDNRTILFISHHMDDVAEYSDEVIVFHAGRLVGHFDASTLFLEKTELLTGAQLPLPEPVQFLKLVEELTGHKIEVESCREQDIFKKVLPIWQARGLINGK
ncbi:energy-coupling factor ABC transporter ATP-binding protein [Paenibacillus sp. KQZ6P-2]|uniref:Energy-coupling factor ABC transporter ATP-binding protein n=1 Tax=Paenibacillus mangrovi TaxID=2931978 RepID=A0A9X1WQR1_9BACL|nr:ATP-binding cassette domain-containing protein [Paenibacillus mangrovi]MCJ8013587.1 energy-coupling factor ABC transporter ATP-binding protein [Paenibacillus mangrovi]